MVAIVDASIGIGTEITYGTAVTPTRFYEFTGETFDYELTKTQGAGMRTGSRLARAGRRVITKFGGGGKLDLEVTSKGMGLLWQAALGTGTSTLVGGTGTTYQQNFTFGDLPSSLTIQKGVIAADDAGTVQAYTFKGCLVDSWDLSADMGDIVKASFTFDARDMATATAYTSPTYPTAPSLFHFAQGAIAIGGTVTAPTTTALATGGTAVANIRSFSLNGSNGLDKGRYCFGAAGLKSRPLRGERKLSGKLVAELTDATLRDAVIADTSLAVVLTFTSAEALSTGTAQLQVVLSDVKFSGNMPKADNALQTLALDFDAFDNLTAAQPIYIVHRTADTAL